jgi:hypothetical protein
MHPKPDLWLPAEYKDFKRILRHWRRRPVRLSHRSILLMGTCSFTAGSHPGSVGALSGHFLEEQHQRISV